jgi:hypothetical protein
MFKGKCGKDIIYMHHVSIFIVLMMGKMLKGEVYKSWDAFIVTLVLWTILIQALNTKKCLITYYKTYGITSLKKHVDAIFVVIVIFFEEEVNSPIKGFC